MQKFSVMKMRGLFGGYGPWHLKSDRLQNRQKWKEKAIVWSKKAIVPSNEANLDKKCRLFYTGFVNKLSQPHLFTKTV